ncbi:hypothetical protein UlMin_023182 [Ulmus minor]
MVAVHLVCFLVQFIYIMDLDYCSNYVDRKFVNNSAENQNFCNELMKQFHTNEKCHDIIRMSPLAFARLCELLRDTGRFEDNKHAIVEEQVVKFMYVLAHNAKNRTISFFFHHSGETISRHFHDVLRAIISLEDTFLRQPNGVEVPQEIITSHRFYSYFKENFIWSTRDTCYRVDFSHLIEEYDTI